MSVKPILFNTDMVRAILDGRKTVTRRLIKPQPIKGHYTFVYYSGNNHIKTETGIIKPPYQPGDTLCVRETWGEGYEEGTYIYKADDKLANLPEFKESSKLIYHPSIHMPKEAARIWLKVKDVRVERLREITTEQARAEGCDGRCECPSSGTYGSLSCKTRDFSIEKFETAWDSNIKKSDLDRYGWDANPWVWVIEFERCEKPEGWRI